MFKRLLLVLVGFSLLAGCGGGGDDGSGSPATGTSSYTGNTAQATVTSSNARVISTNAYAGSQLASSFDMVGKATIGGEGESLLLQEVVSILDGAVTSIAQEPTILAKSVQATSTAQDTIYGYSGWFRHSTTVDNVTGVTKGTISFSHYRAASTSITMTGDISFSGIYSPGTSRFTSLNVSFDNVTVTDGTVSIKMLGSIAASVSGTTRTHKLTLLMTESGGSSLLLKDYTLTLNGTQLVISGTFYHPIHGYVSISTITPLTVSSMSATPTAGQLLCIGSNNTRARLIFSPGGYSVFADVNGNGSYVAVP